MEDREIVDLFWRRSETAIGESNRKYGRYLRTIAYNILKNPEDTEECVNDTYLGAWNSIPPNQPEHLMPYLGKITRNLALDRMDYRTAQKRNHEFDVLLSELEDCLADKNGVEEQVEAKELAETINCFLAGLPKEKRMIFVRRYWYSYSVKDLGKQFSMSESKVKMILFRVRKDLKKYLEKEGIHL